MSAALALVLALVTLAVLWPGRSARAIEPDRALVQARRPMSRTVALAAIACVLLLVEPVLAVVAIAGTWGWRRRRATMRRRRHHGTVVRSLPDAVDLLLLATESGLALALAHPVVAREVRGPLGDALLAADRVAVAGGPRADALVDALSPLGRGATALGHVLADHLRYGTALVPALEAVRAEARAERRHAVQEAARQVPVRLLAPLVLCVLPAFGLLTVVPLLLVALGDLPR